MNVLVLQEGTWTDGQNGGEDGVLLYKKGSSGKEEEEKEQIKINFGQGRAGVPLLLILNIGKVCFGDLIFRGRSWGGGKVTFFLQGGSTCRAARGGGKGQFW